MHIIPKRVHPVDSPQPLDLSLALSAVSDPQVQTKANLKAQDAIQRKISGYPEKANENLHNARCRVPVVVAQVRFCNVLIVAQIFKTLNPIFSLKFFASYALLINQISLKIFNGQDS